MNVRPTARRICAELLLCLITSVILLSAGCSFEAGLTGLECDDEGASRAGEVCRDGYWREVADSTLDASGPQDGGSDVPTDSPEVTDGCTPRSDEEICRDSGTCSDAVSATDRCTGDERTVDCTSYFDFDTDPQHCGSCDLACADSGPNSSPTCADGACSMACDAGWVDANDDLSDGCEAECTPSNEGVEICDGRDNDCDGEVDGPSAADAETYYRDADGDGFGDQLESIQACPGPQGGAPDGYVADDSDCDDSDDTTNPGAPEVCDGTVDNNCDQSVDEQCPCTNGETRPCGTDEGTCRQGTQTCTAGQWAQECRGSEGPDAETCDGLDNDCNGQIDESFADKGSACTVGQGLCQNSGTYVCTADGAGVECDATALSPSAESCDGLDNNCDGQVDEDFADLGDACTVGQGECAATGASVCASDGAGTECDAVAGTPAASETCGDGLDNDCNGQVDDGCHCDYDGESEGVCAFGIVQSDGSCGAPADYEGGREDTCDGLDNDCDGEVDEYTREYLYPDADGDGYGVTTQGGWGCAGTPGYADQGQDCDDGDPWTHPNAQEICDGKDNNCNGFESDDRGNASSSWCQSHFGANSSLVCDGDGPSGTLCCEYDGDPNETYDCDFETICHNGVDEDGDGDTDCADTDCNGLSCAPGKTCQAGSCQNI
jgi:hypothetical protein